MTCVTIASLALQEWMIDWFGETSAVQWIGLFLALLLAAAVGLTVYHSSLRGQLAANRHPSALRSLCAALGAAIAFGSFTLIFYGAFMSYVFAALSFISLAVVAVFLLTGRKLATK
jgi:hypothetical protein